MIRADQAPPQVPPSVPPWNPNSKFWEFWDWFCSLPIEPHPSAHLLGKTSLDHILVEAEAASHQDHPLTAEQADALRVVHEYPQHDDYYDEYGQPERWAA